MRSRFLAILILFMTVFFAKPDMAGAANIADSFDMDRFSSLPVVHEGRIKPLDSFARIHLTVFYHKDSLPNMTAIDWLAELLFDPQASYKRPVFNVASPDVLHAIGLEYRLPHYYSFSELAPALARHVDLYIELSAMPPQNISQGQRHLVELFDAVNLYYDISRSLNAPQEDTVFSVPQNSAQDNAPAVLPSVGFRIVPSVWGKDQGNWFSPWQIQHEGSAAPLTQEYVKIWSAMALAYHEHDPVLWNKAVSTARQHVDKLVKKNGSAYRKGALTAEVFYNQARLFHFSQIFYIAAFLAMLALGSIKGFPARKTAFVLLGAGAFLHVTGLILRIYIMARPPVATLYESVIFVGLVVVIFSIFLEARNKDGLGILIGAALGLVLHFIGSRYAADGDSLGMLSAVLNTNFWLATHVLVITIGYGACLITAVQGHLYLLIRAMHRDEYGKAAHLTRMMLASGLVALFFCVLGTILGGIWADQSWGRFWGWDPKENGAMLICLWLIAMLHGRIAGLFSPAVFAGGMAFLAVIVALAWFGVNLLSVGLHSYGFTENIATNLFLFVVAEVAFLALAGFAILRQKQKVS